MITINVSGPLESRLLNYASKHGVSPEELVLQTLETLLPKESFAIHKEGNYFAGKGWTENPFKAQVFVDKNKAFEVAKKVGGVPILIDRE